jgi:predicted O-linked N-acetylglucosamine transferase (SPINDLY family)/glycosyltransferase involved in cell wall biosynthesis
MMRIAHLSLTDVREGTSGTIRTLIDEQKRSGDEPSLFCFFNRTQDEGVFSLESSADAWNRSMDAFEHRTGISGISASGVLDLWQREEYQQADIVHLHVTTADYFSWLLIPSLAAKPLIWSVYDAQPFTGGCYHTVMCNRWRQDQCNDCAYVAKERRQRQAELYQLKKAIYEMTPMAVVSPNSWLTGQIQESILASRFMKEIPLAVDPVFFRRANQQEIRKRLSIPQDAFVIAYSSPDGLRHPLYGGVYVRQMFEAWREENQKVVLLQIGGSETEESLPEPFSKKLIPFGLPIDQRSAVLQAANVFLQVSPHDASGVTLLEAAAAGIPSVAFAIASANAYVRHLEDGYLAGANVITDLVRGMRFLRSKPQLTRQMGEQAARRITQEHQETKIAAVYREAYQQLLAGDGRSWQMAQVTKEAPSIPPEGITIEELWQITGIQSRVDELIADGPSVLWKELDAYHKAYGKERDSERGIFVDMYLTYVMHRARQPMPPMLLVDIIDQWLRLRQLPQRCGRFTATEKLAAHTWTRLIRQSLETFLRSTPLDFFVQLTQYQQSRLIDLWRLLFFNDFTTPYLEEAPHLENRRKIEATTSTQRIYPDLLIRSMYAQHPQANIRLDMDNLLKKDVPIAVQIILAFWIVNVPYYEGYEKRQKIMRRNATAFLSQVTKNPESLPQGFFTSVVEHFIPQFWRAAYMGGNLLKEISLFGDFLHQQISRLAPTLVDSIRPKPYDGNRKLRIGYVSTNFCYQAVSFYMANRIFCADKQRFEVQVFSLIKRIDSMTDHIKAHSDRFVPINDPTNLAKLGETIKSSDLDILIFADIGMEPYTYQLAAMRLAPVQCVLVGHGVTTGLPTVDYYLSGDFEADDAQEHYREQLVRLPNLGAAQLPPPFPATGKLTRQTFNLPEEAVLLVSCANGIKHIPERDALLVRILQQAPRAMILLKPFMDPSMVQLQWIERLEAAARKGGVGDRLRIIPPLPQGNDMMDFLSLADIQLDTYPYGGWTTNMEAVFAGLAIVTQQGEQARSRWGAHILKALGVDAGIARTEQEYVRQAVELVNNNELRQQTRQRIRERAQEILFNGPAAQPAYEAGLQQIYRQTLEKWPQEAE